MSITDSPTSSEDVQPRSHPAAMPALLLGTASFVLSILAGIPAIIVGYRALYSINESEGRLTGRRAAIGGIVLGVLTTLLTTLGVIVLIFAHLGSKSKQTECQHNFRRIGMAVNLYHNTAEPHVFPPGTIINPLLNPDERLSWQASLLPYLDEGQTKKWLDLNAAIDRTKPWTASEAKDMVVSAFLCPDNPTYDPPERPAPTHYVGIAGVGADAAELPVQHPRAGFFGYDRIIGREEVQGGISNTLMVAETAHANGPWIAGGFSTVRGLDEKESRLIGTNAPFGGCHVGGMNALFVDGSVRFMNANIDPNVLRQLAKLTRE